MSEKRKSKSLEEVELELEYFGLARQTAAAIVRLANNLKQTRKLRAAHIELLTPGRRLHPPSPLGQIVWNQSEIEVEIDIESPLRPDNEPNAASSNEASCSEATTEMNSISGVALSSIDSVTLTDVASSVDNLSISQDPPPPPPPPSEASTDVASAEAEEDREDDDDDDDDDEHKDDDSRWW